MPRSLSSRIASSCSFDSRAASFLQRLYSFTHEYCSTPRCDEPPRRARRDVYDAPACLCSCISRCGAALARRRPQGAASAGRPKQDNFPKASGWPRHRRALRHTAAWHPKQISCRERAATRRHQPAALPAPFAFVVSCPSSRISQGALWSPDGACLLTCAEDSVFRVYDLLPDAMARQPRDLSRVRFNSAHTAYIKPLRPFWAISRLNPEVAKCRSARRRRPQTSTATPSGPASE